MNNLLKIVDNYVSNVHKGHICFKRLMFHFTQYVLENKDILIKDTKARYGVSRETTICRVFLKMPKVFTSETQKIGEIGENIAVMFLVKRGFLILDRNYTKKWGEIDIVAEKAHKLYFIEVKSMSKLDLTLVTREALDQYRPEDNMHPWKMKRMSRTIQTYLLSKKILEDTSWQVDLLVVFLDVKNKKAKIKVVSDIVL